MSIIRVGLAETENYAEGWAAIFGGAKKSNPAKKAETEPEKEVTPKKKIKKAKKQDTEE